MWCRIHPRLFAQFSPWVAVSRSASGSWPRGWTACWSRSYASSGIECCLPWITWSGRRGSQSVARRKHWRVWMSRLIFLRPIWSNTRQSKRRSYDCNCVSASGNDPRLGQKRALCPSNRLIGHWTLYPRRWSLLRGLTKPWSLASQRSCPRVFPFFRLCFFA